MTTILQGIAIGLAYVAPIGMQNLFVINSGLNQSRGRAYLTAFIVIFFDVTLAMICFFGIGLLLEQWDILRMLILLIGGGIVIFIGISLIRSKPPEDMTQDMNMPILKVIGSACVVTWFNPQAIIDGSMLLGASRASLPGAEGLLFLMGVCLASCIWFLSITTITSFFKKMFNPKILRWINIVCGIVIILYGLKLLWQFLGMVI